MTNNVIDFLDQSVNVCGLNVPVKHLNHTGHYDGVLGLKDFLKQNRFPAVYGITTCVSTVKIR